MVGLLLAVLLAAVPAAADEPSAAVEAAVAKVALSPNPAAEALKRLRALSRERLDADSQWRLRVARRVWIGHLVVEHAVPEERVADRLAELDAADEAAVGDEQRRFKLEAALWDLRDRLASPGGEARERIRARRAPKEEPSPAAPALQAIGEGQFTWSEIESLIRRDVAAHPLFWELRPDDYLPSR